MISPWYPTRIDDIRRESMMLKRFVLKIRGIRQESMISHENQWYATKINDIRRESMISDENQWYPTKINDIRRESMISDWNQWSPTKINDLRRESMVADDNQWYQMKINDIKRKQRYNYYIIIHTILLIMCKAIILISVCIQVYDLCTDSIYPCYYDQWFPMIIDDGIPWWKYWFGVKQGLSRGWSGSI